MSKFRNAKSQCKITGSNNAPSVEDGFEADIREGLDGICCGMTVTWIAGVLNADDEATDTALFREYFFNVLRFQGAYLQALHRKNRNEGASEFKFRKLAECLAHGCQKFGYELCNADKLAKAIPGGKDLWAANVSIFHHAIGIAKTSDRLLVMDPNEGLFSYPGTSLRLFCADVSQHIKVRIQGLKKTGNKHGDGVNPGSQFGMTFWEKAA